MPRILLKEKDDFGNANNGKFNKSSDEDRQIVTSDIYSLLGCDWHLTSILYLEEEC